MCCHDCKCVYMYIRICNEYMCTCVYIHTHTHIDIYIYIHVYIYIHTYTYKHILCHLTWWHVHRHLWPSSRPMPPSNFRLVCVYLYLCISVCIYSPETISPIKLSIKLSPGMCPFACMYIYVHILTRDNFIHQTSHQTFAWYVSICIYVYLCVYKSPEIISIHQSVALYVSICISLHCQLIWAYGVLSPLPKESSSKWHIPSPKVLQCVAVCCSVLQSSKWHIPSPKWHIHICLQPPIAFGVSFVFGMSWHSYMYIANRIWSST